ncbi:MAG: geranylgeranylglyceryl/heptaprenylglyceryl phosphate synthase [Crocinitomicaceae bacterium]
MNRYYDILKNGKRKLAILIDPEKTKDQSAIKALAEKINILKPSFLFVGGSTVTRNDLDVCIRNLKNESEIPIILFPGSHQQISNDADGILFLSLISGRNPDYLIGHQVESAHLLREMDLEIIPTGYILIDGGKPTTVTYISQTSPIPADQFQIATHTAIAGEMMGLKAIFLDAGSGAKTPVTSEMISSVCRSIDVPLIVGGGIKNIEDIDQAFDAGADLVVIGNQVENEIDFLLDIKNHLEEYQTV